MDTRRNLKYKPECLKNTKNHSVIILDKVGGGEPETWESGLLIDPMGDNVAFLKECAPR